ncbi:MAG: SDR family NAD(P)-dependent oxidoreductase [Isosphaeraceae bacterium]
MRLNGKKALVTGGGRGIGRGIATHLAREGADVVIDYITNEDEAREAKAEIEEAGRRGLILRADISRVDEARRPIDEAVQQMGSLAILVNNAGVEKQAGFVDVSERDFDLVLNVNLKGPFFLSQAFASYLIESKRPGKIINISSVHEEIPFPGYAPYSASKGGMRMLMRDLAVELSPHGITVNNIARGAIETDMNRSLLDDRPRLEKLLGQIPLGRMGKPADVGAIAAFLASSDADYVTGSTDFVDGGLTYHYQE